MGERAIAKAGGSFGSLMLFMRHLTVHAGAVCLFIVITRSIAGVFGVGGHCESYLYLFILDIFESEDTRSKSDDKQIMGSLHDKIGSGRCWVSGKLFSF